MGDACAARCPLIAAICWKSARTVFFFELRPPPASLSDQDDPLLRHARRPSMTEDQSEAQAFDRNPASFAAPPTKPLHESAFVDAHSHDARDLFASAPQSTQMAPG